MNFTRVQECQWTVASNDSDSSDNSDSGQLPEIIVTVVTIVTVRCCTFQKGFIKKYFILFAFPFFYKKKICITFTKNKF